MPITIVDRNGEKFGETTVQQAVNRCFDYALPNDHFRIYVVDHNNPWPGFVSATVSADSAGTVTIWKREN